MKQEKYDLDYIKIFCDKMKQEEEIRHKEREQFNRDRRYLTALIEEQANKLILLQENENISTKKEIYEQTDHYSEYHKINILLGNFKHTGRILSVLKDVAKYVIRYKGENVTYDFLVENCIMTFEGEMWLVKNKTVYHIFSIKTPS